MVNSNAYLCGVQAAGNVYIHTLAADPNMDITEQLPVSPINTGNKIWPTRLLGDGSWSEAQGNAPFYANSTDLQVFVCSPPAINTRYCGLVVGNMIPATLHTLNQKPTGFVGIWGWFAADSRWHQLFNCPSVPPTYNNNVPQPAAEGYSYFSGTRFVIFFPRDFVLEVDGQTYTAEQAMFYAFVIPTVPSLSPSPVFACTECAFITDCIALPSEECTSYQYTPCGVNRTVCTTLTGRSIATVTSNSLHQISASYVWSDIGERATALQRLLAKYSSGDTPLLWIPSGNAIAQVQPEYLYLSSIPAIERQADTVYHLRLEGTTQP